MSGIGGQPRGSANGFGSSGTGTLRWLLAIVVLALALVLAPVAGAASGPGLSGVSSGDPSIAGATSVAISGTHAYTTAYSAGQLTAIDFSNPSSPFVSGSSTASGSVLDATTVNIVGGFAYVVSKNRNGPCLPGPAPMCGSGTNDDGTGNTLTIFDISTNPAVPTYVGSVTDATKLFGSYGVAVSGNYAYIAAQGCVSGQPCPNTSAGNSFEVVDISNPMSPKLVASLANSALPAPWAGTNALQHACSVTVSGHYAYVTAAYSNRLTIIDIATPTAPVIVSSLPDATNLDFPVDVAVKGNYAYVADQATPLGRIAVVDVSNPASPRVVNTVTDLATLNGAYRIRLNGNFAYVSASSVATVTAIDISDPLSPREAGHLTDTTDLHKTTGLDVDPTGQYVVASSPYLSTQTNPTYPPYIPTPGAGPITGSISVVQLDPAPIGVSITANPTNPTTQTSASFTFATTDAVSSVLCSLDGAPFGFCTSATTQTYSGLAAGSHTFMVKATDAAGSISAPASYTWTIQSAPVNTVAPSISGGASPSPGDQLTASNGTWSGVPAPTFTYQWSDCDVNGANCTAISGATSSTYTVAAADEGSTIEVTVTGTNSVAASAATSGPTAVVNSPPGNTVLPSISGPAAPSPGDHVTASTGTWTGSPAPTFLYQWSDCDVNGANCTAISGATSAGYAVQGSDLGSTLEVTVTGHNVAGSSSATSPPTAVVSSPPVNTVPPSISGPAAPAAGDQLTASTGTWTGTPAPTFTYQWSDCDVNGANCTAISGAMSSTYTVVAADQNSTIEVTVTGTNTKGSSPATSAPTAVISSPPVNTVPPSISGPASPIVGDQLTAVPGTWSGLPAPTFTYQWSDCDSNGMSCGPISGATSSTYLLQGSDAGFNLEVTVTATNSLGSPSATSAITAAVSSPPVNSVPPSISGPASPTAGDQLTASDGTWSGVPAPTFTYQWSDCDLNGANCTAISGATSSTYTAQSSDAASTLEVTVNGTNSAGSSSEPSAPTSVITGAPVNTVLPSVQGIVLPTDTLTATTGTWTGFPAPTYAYQWSVCDGNGANCSPISGQTSPTYVVQVVDVLSTLEVTVTATNSLGSPSATSLAVGPVELAPSNVVLPTISGAPVDEQTLTAAHGTWLGTPGPIYKYQWLDCDVNGANCNATGPATSSSTYAAQPSDVGSTLEVKVTATNIAGSASATSGPTAVVTAAAPVNTVLPSISGAASVGDQLTASDGSWTGTPPLTFTYQWSDCDPPGAGCTSIAGATSPTYTAQGSDVGLTLEVTVKATNSAGSPSATSAPTGVVSSTPANTGLPTISGTTAQGKTLTAGDGAWTGTPAPTFSHQWVRCDSSGLNCGLISGATGATYILAAADVRDTLRVFVIATNSAGVVRSISLATGVVTGVKPPTLTPVISGLRQTAKTWREAAKPAHTIAGKPKTKRLPTGTTFSLTLNVPASVTFSFTIKSSGRKVGGRCRTQTSQNRHQPRCTLKQTVGKVVFAAHKGANKVSFVGRLAHGKKLRPGTYTVAINATAAGKRSKTATLSFTIAP